MVLDRREDRRSVRALLSEALNFDGESGWAGVCSVVVRGDGGARVEMREVMLGERGRGVDGRRNRRVTQVGSRTSPSFVSCPPESFFSVDWKLVIVPWPSVLRPAVPWSMLCPLRTELPVAPVTAAARGEPNHPSSLKNENLFLVGVVALPPSKFTGW